MYSNLEAEIARRGISKKELAKAVNIRYNTLLVKISGQFQFTLDEAIKLKNALDCDLTIEQLFADQKTA